MAFDIIAFLQANGIEYVTEGTKHARPGWVNIVCPFCFGNPGYHLGYNTSQDWWSCWRCGHHRTYKVVLALLGNNYAKAAEAMQEFQGRPEERFRRNKRKNETLELPPGLQPLTKRARKYLINRNFDPDMLEAVWRVQSTANIGNLSYRIFIPVYVDAQMVTWQARDVTGIHSLKYLTQSSDKEIISVRDVVYGIDQCTNDTCVIVEGVPDVWRLGPGAVATFGIKYRPSQLALLLERFTTFHILFDPEPQARLQAEKLGADLSALGGKAKIWTFDGCDPGDMPQEVADEFMREVFSVSR